DLSIGLPQVDLLFIDTWHIYGHLKRELAKHHPKVNKYIILHDTTVDEWLGETIRCNLDYEQQCLESGYQKNEILLGLWPAVDEFLKAHPEWSLHKRYTNNNGLTILKRRQPPPTTCLPECANLQLGSPFHHLFKDNEMTGADSTP